jgi:hypothetical protein
VSATEATLVVLTTLLAYVGGGEKFGKWVGTALGLFGTEDDRDYLAAVGATAGGLFGFALFLGLTVGEAAVS